MYINEINARKHSKYVYYEANISWEESNKSPLSWFVETESQFSDCFWPDPNAFLLGAVLPAWHAGEKRVKIEGPLCPVLNSNLNVALGVMKDWYPEMGSPPVIESNRGFRALSPFKKRAASLLSCGVDSLATLRWNMQNLPVEHPLSIKGAFFLEHVNEPGSNEMNLEGEQFLRRKFIKRLDSGIGIDIIPIRSNILALDGDGWFYTVKWHGAAMCALSCFFSKGFERVYIASSANTPATFGPWGSHPLLDTRYSSAHFVVEHHGLHLDRLAKTALIAKWPLALKNVLVCQKDAIGNTNCGKCEKCIWTMTALSALGVLAEAPSFPVDDVTPELLRTVQEYDMIRSINMVERYESLIPILSKKGRSDLVDTILQFRSYWNQKAESEFSVKDIKDIVPPGESFVLADPAIFGKKTQADRRGYHWGLPSDDATAIREIKNLRENGSSFLILPSKTYWWLDYFPNLRKYLQDNSSNTHQANGFVAYDMRSDFTKGTIRGAKKRKIRSSRLS